MSRGLRLGALITAGALLGLVAPVAVVSAPAEAAAAAVDCSRVFAGPEHAQGGENTGYFDLRGDAGSSTTHRLLVANPSDTTCTVRLERALGKTATNSGNSYVPATGSSCTGPACWIDGLPATVRVKAKGRLTVPFTVRVPKGTSGGQYLAGVLASPVAGDATDSGAQVRMRVTTRVAVGVAVQVTGALRPKLSIPSVTIDASQAPARTVRIVERNQGNTWEHPSGALTVQMDGRTVRIPLTSNTLLAANEAALSVGAESVPAGTYPAEVHLQYAGGAQEAVWRGDLTFDTPPTVQQNGSTVLLTSGSPWMPALVGATVGLGLVVLLLLLLLLRRRRRDEKDVATP